MVTYVWLDYLRLPKWTSKVSPKERKSHIVLCCCSGREIILVVQFNYSISKWTSVELRKKTDSSPFTINLELLVSIHCYTTQCRFTHNVMEATLHTMQWVELTSVPCTALHVLAYISMLIHEFFWWVTKLLAHYTMYTTTCRLYMYVSAFGLLYIIILLYCYTETGNKPFNVFFFYYNLLSGINNIL